MANLFWFGAGVLVSYLVARHYHARATNKSIGLYRIQASEIFAGITEDVRSALRFTYRDQEVEDLTQLEFIVANDGERAISNVIEPLRLDLPPGASLLDASILYRSPEALNVRIDFDTESNPQKDFVTFEFPLLNKDEFFLVKLLISGKIKGTPIKFRLMAEDLPRSPSFKWLPPAAMQEKKFRPDWTGVTVGTACLLFAVWLVWVSSLIVLDHPEYFPYPWDSYQFSVMSVAVVVPGVIWIVVLALLGIFGTWMSAAEGTRKGPNFPLPKEIRSRHHQFPFMVSKEPDQDD